MRGLSTRVTVNVLTVLIVSVVLVIGLFLTYVSGVLFDDEYEVSVMMPDAGGVLPQQAVTVMGRAVGQVGDVSIADDGVRIDLDIRGDQQVPARADVQVMRRSPIGEQAVDFRPVDDGWQAAEPGTVIEPREATVPAPVPFLLEQTVELFEAVEPADVSTLTSELATALEGRGPRLRDLNRDLLDLNRTLVDGIPELDRLIDSSEVVLTTLRDHRDSLAGSMRTGADVAEILADNQDDLGTLLDTGERALDQVDVFTRNTRANLSCLTRDITAVNEMLLGPSTYEGEHGEDFYASKLEELERLLVRNRYFLQDGFHIITQDDPGTGLSWVRMELVLDGAMNAEFYEHHRPTGPVLPGAACESDEWGLGVNAVRQSDPAEPHPTSPGIDFAPLVDGDRERATPSTSPEGDDQ